VTNPYASSRRWQGARKDGLRTLVLYPACVLEESWSQGGLWSESQTSDGEGIRKEAFHVMHGETFEQAGGSQSGPGETKPQHQNKRGGIGGAPPKMAEEGFGMVEGVRRGNVRVPEQSVPRG